MDASRNSKIAIKVIAVCFFLSGMAGLIYQVVWTKMLGLVFGHTSLAISTVVASFLAGLALGSFFIGKIADRENNIFQRMSFKGHDWRLFAYGLAEIVIGVFSLLTPWLFSGVELVYSNFLHLPFMIVNLLRFFLCFIVLILPTMAMGATLPVISKFLISSENEVGPKLGFIYSINTAGSVLGTLLAGFVLLPQVGNWVSLQTAAVFNIGIGLFMFSYSRGFSFADNKNVPAEEKIVPSSVETSDDSPKEGYDRAVVLLFTIVFAVSGFASLVYELSWNRALALALGSSTYAFTSMLAVFLFGTALGSYIFSKVSAKKEFTIKSFAFIQLCIAVSSFLCSIFLGYLPVVFSKLLAHVSHSYNLVILMDFFLCFVAMILPTTFIGISFPLAGKLYSRNIEKLGSSIGNIYAINTIGSVTGSFLTGFVLMPFLGARTAILIGVFLNLAAALALILKIEKNANKKYYWITACVLLVIGILITPSWDKKLMTAGFFRGPAYSDYKPLLTELLYYKDGISSTVSVRKMGTHISLQVNGKTDASNSGDMDTQFLVGALPTLYVQKPEKTYLIGLGSGVTAYSVLLDKSVKRLDCAEIEPSMKDAAAFFNDYNGNVLKNPRFFLHEADGRSQLKFSKNKYDIIISEPSNPWVAGVASLFTKEFYEMGKSKLSKNGVMCVWLQLYLISPQDVKMIFTTINSVFPHLQVWLSPFSADCLILCSNDPLQFKMDKYRELFAQEDFKKMYELSFKKKTPETLFAGYIGSKEDIILLTSGGRVNTDDLLSLEYSAPLSLYSNDSFANMQGLLSFKTPPQNVTGSLKMSAEYYGTIYDITYLFDKDSAENYLKQGLKLYPTDPLLNYKQIRIYREAGSINKMYELLDKNIANSPDKPFFISLKAYFLSQQDDIAGAQKLYTELYHKGQLTDFYFQDYIANLLKEKKYAEVIKIAKTDETNNNPRASVLLPMQFKAEEALGMHQAAQKTALRAEKFYSESLFLDLTSFYLKMGNLEKAREIAIKNYNQTSGSPFASESLIKVFLALKDNSSAKDIALTALYKYPYNKYFNSVVLNTN